MTTTRKTSPDGFVVVPARDGRTVRVWKDDRSVVAEPTPEGLAAARAALDFRPTRR